MASGMFMVLLGVWVLAQVFRGGLLTRIGL